MEAKSQESVTWSELHSSLASSEIDVKREEKVRSYLDRHPDLFGVTGQVCQAARREFGSQASLTLQVYCDPEIEDEYLLLRVRLPSYAADTLQRIRALSDPYETELCADSGSIVVTTDFRPLA
jgi:hypothetical protein